MISVRAKGVTARSMTEVPNATAPLILYVDDERANRIVFEQSLKSDYRIKTLPSAKTALEFLEAEEVAVIVTDIRMPDMDGLELLTIVKERYPNTLRMVITAFSDIDPILRAINEGLVARYIIKPFERDELAQVLRWATELWSVGKTSAAVVRRMLETERLAALGGLTALYLHDLRTPLAATTLLLDDLRALAEATPALHDAIAGAAIDDRLKQRLLERVDDTPELVNEVKASTTAVSGMVGDLWHFIRPPKSRAERPIIDPLPVIRHTLSMYQKLSLYQEAHIDYCGPTELPQVRMSPIALTQVLLNLIGNAAQAVLARSLPNLAVAIDARPAGDMLELQIRDEGVGMPPEVLRRIGTPYFTTRSEGTGLGVANVQRLIGTAGGRVKFESEQGVGTTVTLLLPIAA